MSVGASTTAGRPAARAATSTEFDNRAVPLSQAGRMRRPRRSIGRLGTHATVVQHQHALSADGLSRRLGAEHPAGAGRQRDASGWLHADDPVPPLRYGPVAVPLMEQGQRRPGGGLGNCRTLRCSSGVGEPDPSNFT